MSSSPNRSILAVVAALFLGSGCIAAEGIDHPAVMKRWDMNYYSKCSSWLYSQSSGVRYCASPAFHARPMGTADDADAGPQFDETKTDKASLVAAGETVYGNVCAACHQADGKGLPGVFPPLAGSSWVTGAPDRAIKIVLQGLQGPIEVNGMPYNALMTPQGGILSDAEIAGVLTHVRASWGNAASAVTAEQVTAIRSATADRTTPWTAAELSAP